MKNERGKHSLATEGETARMKNGGRGTDEQLKIIYT
jgi:hypothetical protein